VKRTPLKRKTGLRRDTDSARIFADRGRRSSAEALEESGRKTARSSERKGGGFRASPAQRAKVEAYGACIVCGREPDWDGVPLDPAHVIDRSLHPDPDGDPLRVVPVCRVCHTAYDDGLLDLLPFLEPGWRAELAEAVRCVGLIRALQRITNLRWAESGDPKPMFEREDG
jgi:hypothetical protein